MPCARKTIYTHGKGLLRLTPIFRDGKLQVEKPAAIIDDTDYTYTSYYSLVSIKPVLEY